MAEQDPIFPDDSAEKAYAAASEAQGTHPAEAEAAPVAAAPVEPAPVALAPAGPAPVEAAPVALVPETPVEAAPVAFPPRSARKPVEIKAKAKAPAKTPAKTAPARKAAAKAPPKPVAPKFVPAKSVPAAPVKAPAASKPKEMNMSDTKNFADGIQKVVSESQDKVKQAYAKGTALFGEYGDFAKGNVEAVVASGKILATGLQGMGQSMLTETKSAFETMTSDVKELTSVKSPTDFVKVQGQIVRRNLDQAVALTSKNSEAMLKLAGDAFAPISGRFTLAMAKFKKAA